MSFAKDITSTPSDSALNIFFADHVATKFSAFPIYGDALTKQASLIGLKLSHAQFFLKKPKPTTK